MTSVAIHWFRQDLRLADNPALSKAVEAGRLLPIYILDDDTAGEARMGGASRWWLHRSLEALDRQLGGKLRLYRGKAEEILPQLVKIYDAQTVSWTRCYEPWRIKRDKTISSRLELAGCRTIRLNGSLLWEPWSIKKQDGTPYKVFTPFYRKGCLQAPAPAMPMAAPHSIAFCAAKANDGALSLGDLGLLSKIGWHDTLEPYWEVSEKGGADCLAQFIDGGLDGYKTGRDFPSLAHISRLSPYLHFGQLSPNQVWHATERLAEDQGVPAADIDHFRSELAWREFSYSLLYYNPDLPSVPIQAKFADFEWQSDEALLKAWQSGLTGVPIVDAGMRELWQTGYMHNRVRMIVASFLIKNLRIDWRQGEAWFWDTLVDADLANNAASWQWVAGCGADAAPFFRIFNPVLQAEKFDPEGIYIRTFVPELAKLPNKYLARPWEAPSSTLQEAGVTPGESYPNPVVDLKHSREMALEAYKRLSEG
ncbi:deoxyribodipyrimidine photo-lyase [uncultured Cohaesibacter sp.]|uniref:cryptochrome/photolyase family protein n=1 Tax=uncultured Cohaesibacter sp. TaxID=1002546 RepID=UPI00292E83F1|nr:deoxyribodipyrimidine photo-lyase [uncultured Cohaesibacter sp.]